MKLALVCLCLLHVALASGRIFTRNQLQASLSGSRAQDSHTGSLYQGRQRPLFARRGQYERHSVPKARVLNVSSNAIPPPPKEAPDPVKPMCSQLAQSCLPQSGCCEPHTMCHCRFFNAICFCRRTNVHNEKKRKIIKKEP